MIILKKSSIIAVNQDSVKFQLAKNNILCLCMAELVFLSTNMLIVVDRIL